MDLMRAADILVEKVKKDYIEDVAIIVIMGSNIYHDTHSRSDLDVYYVPKTERGKNLGITFIIEGVGFDLWPISWERLEQIANYDEKTTSIITEGKVYYYASEEDLEIFNYLKAKALDVNDKLKFLEKAQSILDGAYKSCFKLLDARNLSDTRTYAMDIIFSITYALAVLNRTTIKRGRGKLKKEIMEMPLVPKDFALLYEIVFASSDIAEIKTAYRQLLRNTQELILKERAEAAPLCTYEEVFDGHYEELINFYNKIYHACEISDTATALFAAVEIRNELESTFSDVGVAPLLPDIVGAFNPQNTEGFLEAVHRHQAQVVELHKSNGVKFKVFKDFDELKAYMDTL